MFFRGSPVNRPARLVASLLVVCLGSGLAVSGFRPAIALGLVIVVPGLISLVRSIYEGFQERHEQQDPYDLSRLWEAPLPERAEEMEPEEDDIEREFALCHNCGAPVAIGYAICPQCGRFLGQ